MVKNIGRLFVIISGRIMSGGYLRTTTNYLNY